MHAHPTYTRTELMIHYESNAKTNRRSKLVKARCMSEFHRIGAKGWEGTRDQGGPHQIDNDMQKTEASSQTMPLKG